MGALDPGLDQRFRQVVEEIRASEARLARRIDAVETGLADLRHHVDVTAAETRLHFDVVAEALRSDVTVVAEGVAALDEKTERFRGEVHEEFGKVDRRFTHLEARVFSTRERS